MPDSYSVDDFFRSREKTNRGRALFHSQDVGCATCHKHGKGTDATRHDAGTGERVDTPSLRYVVGSAPYFHDGSHATLEALLRDTKGVMGWGGHLTGADLLALQRYLETL